MKRLFARTICFVSLAFCPILFADADESETYGIYCVNGKTTIARQSLEEMKTFHGREVCRLYQDPTEAGALEKLSLVGGSGAPCSCPQR